MNPDDAIRLLKAIIARERRDGCPMADDCLIEPALRRWRGYDRRFKQHKHKSLEHRALDLAKGLMQWHHDRGWGPDPSCIQHLAVSFAEALMDRPHNAVTSHHGGMP